MTEVRTCRSCGSNRGLEKFYRRGSYLFLDCKACCARKSRNKRSDAAFRRREKSAGFKYRYGITIEDAEALLHQQGGGCGICRDAVTLETGHVDHCHRTGQVRGVLCRRCNVGLGQFLDNPFLMDAGASYLRLARKEERPCLAS